MNDNLKIKNQIVTYHIQVYGIVQGVGFRPTVSRHAKACNLAGTVCNKGPFVEIFVQGSEEQVQDFLHLLKTQPPKRAIILNIKAVAISENLATEQFDIIESEKVQGEMFISPDIAICEECTKELFDPKDRRYMHPFINCTCCGPRMTILEGLPYDRVRTSMKEFPMCPSCEDEYTGMHSRRYDAQPVCCNDCGPQMYAFARSKDAENGWEKVLENPITYARRCIANGGIIAVKGIGGFHLCCDATNEKAVRLLRERKHRPAKPFAVMMKNIETAERECSCSERQKEILTGHQKPIILLKRKENNRITEAVAPGNPKLGVMLPYAPIHLLLFTYTDEVEMPECLVMTSGNASGAPICRDDEGAFAELGNLCDCILSHDRKIRIRADDTVMDFFEDRPYMIRRSRGYAPLPVMTEKEQTGTVLAIGGELKNTFCLGVNKLYYPSPYVGDLEDLRTVAALEETIGRFETLLHVKPEMVVCDLHPVYHSTQVAKELGLPMMQVQHHYAHVLSCMAENDYHDPVIGISFDGTGYGTDGTIWGGELLYCTETSFRRLGSVRPFKQSGGDASAREGWRIAVAMIRGIWKEEEESIRIISKLGLCSEQAARVQMKMAELGINTVTSTSAGRLFDGVSAILGVRLASTFEGEASTNLQFAAERAEQMETTASVPYVWDTNEEGMVHLPTEQLVKMLVEKKLAGEDTNKLAYLFHEQLAHLICEAALKMGEQEQCHTAALSGGVFQNTLLLKLTAERLKAEGWTVLQHEMIPPNDGGIALGQAAYAMAVLAEKNEINSNELEIEKRG